MAIELRRAGYTRIRVFEKASSVGGTWRDNRYPGISCDVPSHLYSYSFELNPDWSHAFASGREIQQYCERCADSYGLRSFLRLDCEIVQASQSDSGWRLRDSEGRDYEADILISAMGGLHLPSLPDIEGRERFSGISFHSAQWDDNVDLAGKRVAVIGSAASAVQIVPALASKVERLMLFQRTPNWVLPRGDRAVGAWRRRAFAKVPGLARLYRSWLYWLAESRWPAFRSGSIANRIGQLWSQWHLRRQVPDAALRARLMPGYPMGCKRVLRSDDFYPALTSANVDLVTDAITAVDEDAIVTENGTRYEADVIVYATGFRVFDVTAGVEITGTSGQTLQQRWADGIEAHRTVALPGFPNFFMLMGPNSGLGHNSVIFMIECQARYIVACLALMGRSGWRTIEPRQQAFQRYQQELQDRLERTVWTGACSSWYRDQRGRIFTLWPRSSLAFWQQMRKVRADEYHGRR